MKKTVMLKKSYEFKSILTKGKRFKGNCFDIFIKKNSYKDKNMLGIAVSKKAGNSVKRNKIKRLIRENYKNIEKEIMSGYSIIFLWKKESNYTNFNFYTIMEETKKLFNESKIL